MKLSLTLKKLAFCFVLVMLLGGIKVQAIPTGTVSTLSFNTTISVEKRTNDAFYWYKIPLKAGQGVNFQLNATLNTGYLHMEMYDEFDNSVGRISYISNGKYGNFHFRAERTSTYYVKVYGDGLGIFKLTPYNAWYNTDNNDTTRKFSSTQATAKYIKSGTKIINYDADFHRFTANKGTIIGISVTSAAVSGDIHLSLLDGYGNVVSSYNYISNGETGTVNYTAPLSGLYYISVEGGNGTYTLNCSGINSEADSDVDLLKNDCEYYYGTNPLKADSDGDGVSDYAELAKGTSPLHKLEYTYATLSKYTTMAAAMPLTNFDTHMIFEKSGYTNLETWYKFNLKGKESITILADPKLNTGYMHVYLYNSAGTQINQGTYLSSSNVANMSLDAIVDTTYYLKVTGDGVGKYRLGLHHNWYSPGITDASRVLNSTLDTAKYIKSGVQTFNSEYDSSTFRFKATAGKNLSINFTPSLTSGYAHIYLYDENGNHLSSSTYITNGTTRIISYTPALSGIYYLSINGYVKEGNLTYTGILSEGDITPPKVSSTNPSNNKTYVAINPAITVNFSENIYAGTYYNNIALRTTVNGVVKSIPITKSIVNNVLTIKPVANLAYGTVYSIYIPSKAVKDKVGNLFLTSYTSTFTTVKRVIFKDANLEREVRTALKLPTGYITASHMLTLKQLCASSSGIIDLTGLEYATNLQRLILNNNSLTSITQLKYLKNLVDLNLSNNKIVDITPLAALTKLSSLQLYNNLITSITPLVSNAKAGGFVNMGFIDLRVNKLNLTSTSQAYMDLIYLKSKGIYLKY
jgi:hypothetical protein